MDRRLIPVLAVIGIGIVVLGTSLLLGDTNAEPEVVIYTSVDQVYSEPVFRDFERVSGIRVKAVYDVEAAKTTGLVNRLLAEKPNPVADVFWNGEVAQTVLLKKSGALAPYRSASATDIPAQYQDPEMYWTGFGGRARVLLVNTDLLIPAEYPDSIFDLGTSSAAGDQTAMAYPLFGTTATQASALYAILGVADARRYYETLQERRIRIVDGNAAVRDLVVQGEAAIGITDSDDACGALSRGAPVTMIVPDQGDAELGTLMIPNTVALIQGAPHPDEGRIFIDYLLSTETESHLLTSGWIQATVRPGAASTGCGVTGVKGMNVTFEQIADAQDRARKDMLEIFVRA